MQGYQYEIWRSALDPASGSGRQALTLHTPHPIPKQEIARYKVAASRPGALTSMINYYRALYRYDPRYPK